MNAKAITWPQGRYNPAGITQFYYAFWEDIESMQVLGDPETAETYEELVEYTEAIVMKPGKCFYPLHCTLEKGEVRCDVVGGRDGKGFEHFAEISFPGNKSEFLGFLAACANRDVVCLAREKNKVFRVVGSQDDPAAIDTAPYTSGKAIADSRETIVTLRASAGTPPPIYTLPIADLLVPAPDPGG